MSIPSFRLARVSPLIAAAALLLASCGQPPEVAADTVPSSTTTSSTTTSTAAVATTATNRASVVAAPTTLAVVIEPIELIEECVPLVEANIEGQQAFVDEYASMTLADLAALPDAPATQVNWWDQPDGEPIEGTFIPKGEEPPELIAQIELRERCDLDLFLAPIIGAGQIDLETPAGAIAWSQAQTPFLLYLGLYTQSEEALERFGDRFVAPAIEMPVLPSPDVNSCEALAQVVLDGVQSGISTGSWDHSEERPDWLKRIEANASALGCQEPFFARTVASYGHWLTATRWFEVQLRTFIIVDAWSEVWESFRP